MEKFAISQDGKINQRLVFETKQEAFDNHKIKEGEKVVPVWAFEIWFRQYDDKDFIDFYSEKTNIEDATDDAIRRINGSIVIVNPTFGVVARHGKKMFNNQNQ